MNIAISTIRPGLLVSLSTSVTGNVKYRRRDIEQDHIDVNGVRRATWETEKAIEDPAEHEEAIKVRSRIRTIITSLCAQSSFGLLCPEAIADQLGDAIREGRDLADDFNARARLTRIAVYVIAGRIAPDDVEAVRAINSEIRDLMTTMESGLQRLDVKVVRDAADRARGLASMLSPDAAIRAQTAIEAARSAARRIVKAGEAAAIEIDEATLETIRSSRTAFLDLYDAQDMEAPTEAGRAIDFDEAPPVIVPQAAIAPQIEI